MINAKEVLDNFYDTPIKNHQLIKLLFARESTNPCYLIGKNEQSKALTQHVKITGIIDDFDSSNILWNGIKVVRTNELPQSAIVINCSMSISPVSVEMMLSRYPNIISIPYADILRANQHPSFLPSFVTAMRNSISNHEVEFHWVYQNLADENSRSILNTLLSYRLTGDLSHMKSYSVRLNDQYFEPFLGSFDNANFLDCGGYDGDTTEEFISRYPAYANIYFFEPSQKNMQKAKERLKGKQNIHYIPLGVSDKVSTLSFDVDSGSACAVTATGGDPIDATTIDTIMNKPASFIKMDLEGWELKALAGAEKQIKKHQPILAIAVYHAASDFWKIPKLVLSFNPNYKLYLRHYTEGWSETVMYFVPTHHSE